MQCCFERRQLRGRPRRWATMLMALMDLAVPIAGHGCEHAICAPRWRSGNPRLGVRMPRKQGGFRRTAQLGGVSVCAISHLPGLQRVPCGVAACTPGSHRGTWSACAFCGLLPGRHRRPALRMCA